jgi:oxygen-independent coproporphyrinogen III oxidase
VVGIYLHIPFCKQACNYCNFHFTTSLRYKGELVQALAREVTMQKPFLEGETVETIYFGGGTPSLLTGDELQLLLQTIYKEFDVAAGAEITLEANPDDITAEKLEGWKERGINRLSIGIQSFFEEELRWMNRAHNAGQAEKCIELSLAAGFQNFSIDLIYGSPLLTDDMWQQNVAKAVGYGITHLSCYALTVEEKTPLHKLISTQQKQPVDADKQARQFLQLMQWLKRAGYEHYEVSNFALPGYRSRHNSAYWQGKKYLGLGPSAHSYNGRYRAWNKPNNPLYIRNINNGILPFEKEELTTTEQLNELIMISLRTAEGLDLARVQAQFGERAKEAIEKGMQKHLAHQLITQNGSRIQLTESGMLMADGIAADLFF